MSSKSETEPIISESADPHPKRLAHLALDLAVVLAGAALLAYGLVMTISTPWGTSPWNVFHLGVVNHTSLTLGRVSQLVGLVLIGISWLLKRRYVTLVTVINALVVGWLIDLYESLGWVPYVSGLWGLLYLEAGVAVFAAGMALYLAPRRGAGPRDALMMSLSDRLHRPVGPVRIALDFLVIGLGILLHGPVGAGTLLAALTLGPWVQCFLQPFERWNRRLKVFAGARPTRLTTPTYLDSRHNGSAGSIPKPAKISSRRR